MSLIAYLLNLPYSSLLSATICGPRTLSFSDRPFLDFYIHAITQACSYLLAFIGLILIATFY